MKSFSGRKVFITFICIALLAFPSILSAATPDRDNLLPGKVDYSTIDDGHRQILRATVTSADGDQAQFTYDGRTIQFGDGYRIINNILESTDNQLILLMTAWTPEGKFEATVIRYNRLTNEAQSTSFLQFGALLRSSHDARLVTEVLGRRDHLGRPIAGNGFNVQPQMTCIAATLALVAVEMATVESCMSGNALGCIAGMIGIGLAMGEASNACPPAEYDNTIGWG